MSIYITSVYLDSALQLSLFVNGNPQPLEHLYISAVPCRHKPRRDSAPATILHLKTWMPSVNSHQRLNKQTETTHVLYVSQAPLQGPALPLLEKSRPARSAFVMSIDGTRHRHQNSSGSASR